jgi:hypothetical protein
MAYDCCGSRGVAPAPQRKAPPERGEWRWPAERRAKVMHVKQFFATVPGYIISVH